MFSSQSMNTEKKIKSTGGIFVRGFSREFLIFFDITDKDIKPSSVTTSQQSGVARTSLIMEFKNERERERELEEIWEISKSSWLRPQLESYLISRRRMHWLVSLSRSFYGRRVLSQVSEASLSRLVDSSINNRRVELTLRQFLILKHDDDVVVLLPVESSSSVLTTSLWSDSFLYFQRLIMCWWSILYSSVAFIIWCVLYPHSVDVFHLIKKSRLQCVTKIKISSWII